MSIIQESPLWQPFQSLLSDVRSAEPELIKRENREVVIAINEVLSEAMGDLPGTKVSLSPRRIIRNAGFVANHAILYRTIDVDKAIAAMRKGRALLVEHGMAD